MVAQAYNPRAEEVREERAEVQGHLWHCSGFGAIDPISKQWKEKSSKAGLLDRV